MSSILDLSGLACPAPLVKSRKAMDKMRKGETLEIVVSDEDSKVNIALAARELGMDVERIRNEDGKWYVIVTKKLG